MRLDESYVIFVSDAPTPAPEWLSALTGEWLERYYVLHEYGHIQEGDVFKDDPDRFIARRRDAGVHQAVEDAADSWAAHLLSTEALEAGYDELAEQLDEYITTSGFSNPVRPA